MGLSDRSIEFINRKVAGMYALCEFWGNTLENHAKQNAEWNDRTSHARQALHGGVERSGEEFAIFLSHGVEYGGILETGSKPHIIKPKNKKALYWRGAAHPVRKVHHPGTEGKPIVEPTLENNKERIRDNVINYWSD